MTYGEAPWQTMTAASLAEAAGELAFSADKAEVNEVEWTSFIAGPSLEIMTKYLDQAAAESYIPYAATLSAYITPEEAAARYASAKAFFEQRGHYWIGTGPYILNQVNTTEKIVTIVTNPDYPDLSDKWSMFGDPKVAEVELDGEAQAVLGTDFVFDVAVTFEGKAYAADEIKEVKVMLYDATGLIVYTGVAELVEDGVYTATIPADKTAAFEAGASKVEVAVIPYTVSIPTFADLEFVTVK
jgi:peptide/nickel transport system substrate-binding protein